MMGGKPPDSHCVPLCQEHHRERHDKGQGFFYSQYSKAVTMEIIKLLTEYLQEGEK